MYPYFTEYPICKRQVIKIVLFVYRRDIYVMTKESKKNTIVHLMNTIKMRVKNDCH